MPRKPKYSLGVGDIPRTSVKSWVPGTAIQENYPRYLASVVGAKPGASGTIQLTGGHVLLAGVTYSTITFFSGTAAAVAPLNQWFALYHAETGAKIGVTNDDTSTAW